MSAEPSGNLVFGKYRLVGVMNSGGMAELFLALQAGLEGFTKVVALKRVLPHLAESPDFVQMFLDEARLAARLDHPNIVRIYDFGESSGRYFMAMEYLPGEDLSRILHLARKTGQKVPPDIAAIIVQATAEGLHFAHELTDTNGQPLGLVHRDANPSNILVTYYGAIKVVDFGVAKALNNVGHTQAGQIKGKLAYLAPEQVTSDPVDRRADIFCLGIVLWETLTGKKLFARENDVASAQAVVTMQVPAPSRVRPDVPAELDAICLKALSKNPALRYQSAGELQDALDDYFRGRTVRPSSKDIALWLENLFGTARADAKRAIAQGRNLRTSISVVMKALESQSVAAATPQEAGSNGFSAIGGRNTPDNFNAAGPPQSQSSVRVSSSSVRRAPPPPPTSMGKRIGLAAGLAAVAAGAMVAGTWITNPNVPEKEPLKGTNVQTATLTIESDPSQAFVFVGGEPTGQFTPVTLTGLSPKDALVIRVEKDGFEAARETVQLRAGHTVRRSLVLQPLVGQVYLRKLPAGARLVVDGSASPSTDTLRLRPGKHVLEVKVAGQIVGTRTIDVKPGDQTVQFE